MAEKKDLKQNETYNKWKAIKDKSPAKAYGLLALALTQMGVEAGQVGLQSIGNSISEKGEVITSKIKAIKDQLDKTYDNTANYYILSDRFVNKARGWFDDTKK